jgi:hypothetical protein
MELQHILEEFIAVGRPIAAFFDDDESTFDIYINPTQEEVKRVAKSSPPNEFISPPYDRALRAFIYKSDLYVWGAMNQIHRGVYTILEKNGIDMENARESAIPFWLYLDKNYRVFEVRVSPTVSSTMYYKYSSLSTLNVSPEIFKFIKPNPHLKSLCSPTIQWSVKMGD